jgi:phospholipid/cholesterol/gamma-HCH transport system ATP-binding protein
MILYDEPFVGLDPISMGVVVRLIRRLNDTLGLTSVIVTHDVHEVTAIADFCYLLSAGKVMGAGSPQSLADSASEWVRQFMNGLDDGPVPFHYPAPDYARDLLGDAA